MNNYQVTQDQVDNLDIKAGHKYKIVGGHLDGRRYFILAIAEGRVMYRQSVRENYKPSWEYSITKMWVLKVMLLNAGSNFVDEGKFEYIQPET